MFCGLVRQCCSITQFLMKASTIRCALKILGVSYLVVSINGDLNLADVLGETHNPPTPTNTPQTFITGTLTMLLLLLQSEVILS